MRHWGSLAPPLAHALGERRAFGGGGGLVDGTALAAPLPILPPCVCCLVDTDLGLRATISAARFALAPVVTARNHDGSVLIPLAITDPHMSVPAPVGIVTARGLLTGLTSPRTAHSLVRGIGGTGVRIAVSMGGIVQTRMFTVILGPV